MANSVRNANADDAPFHHLRFDRVFPDDFYAEMLLAMPVADDYRAMSGKSKMGSSRPDGKPTRTKIDLFPEYIRHLPPMKREIWDASRPGIAFQRVGESFHATTRARLGTQVRRRLREREDVSGPNPNSRYSWISHLQTHR